MKEASNWRKGACVPVRDRILSCPAINEVTNLCFLRVLVYSVAVIPVLLQQMIL